jgi:hypothetical protein
MSAVHTYLDSRFRGNDNGKRLLRRFAPRNDTTLNIQQKIKNKRNKTIR